MYLYDGDGNRYLDAVGGAGVAVIGHGVTEIGAALAAAGDTVTYAYGAAFTTPWQEEYAERLRELARPSEGGAVYFTSGGSEANETAVKLARQYHVEQKKPGKYKVVARWHSFHGMTLGTLALSARATARTPFEPYLMPVGRFATPDCYRCPFALEHPSCGIACADDLERVLLEEGPDSVAAVIVEPLVGTTLPAVTPPPEYYARIRAICDRYDVLLIDDEVLTGFGRTGRFLALSHWGVEADIVTMGKGIGGGYAALGAVIAGQKIVDALRGGTGQFVHGFTFSGLPASCLIGLAVLDHAADLFPRVAARGAYLRARLDDLKGRHDMIGAVRGRGLLVGMEFVQDRATRRPIDPSRRFAARVATEAQRRGVLIRPGLPGTPPGQDGDHLQISPPYIIAEEHIDTLVSVVDDVVGAVSGEVLP